MVEQRYGGGSLRAMAAVLEQDTEDSHLSIKVSNLVAAGQSVEGTLALDLFKGGDQVAMMADSSLLGFPLDANLFYSKDFIGLSSQALLGSGTVYGATPGQVAKEAQGSIFDPVTGSVPIDAATLKALDDAMNDLDTQSIDPEKFYETMDALSLQYEDFVQSVKPKKTKGIVASLGLDATVLTYVYPSAKVLETLRVMSDTYWSSEYVEFYYKAISASGNQIGYNLDDVRGDWDRALADLTENYTGDITVQYYLVDNTVAYMEVSAQPTYGGNPATLEAYIDFGLGGDTLNAQNTMSSTKASFQMSLTSKATSDVDKANHGWTLKCSNNGTNAFTISGLSNWDKSDGQLHASLQVDSPTAALLLDASGSLIVSGTNKFELTLASLTVDNGATPYSCGLALVHESDAVFPHPLSTKNVFKFSEEELYLVLQPLLSAVAPLVGY